MQDLTRTEPDWAEVVANAHRDSRFRFFGVYCGYGEVDGINVGIVYATINPGYNTLALNKHSIERLRDAKRTGKVDVAFVGAARISGSTRSYCGHMTVEEAWAKIEHFGLEPRMGKFGEFYILPLGFFPATEDEPY
jgi:hypothetical protein